MNNGAVGSVVAMLYAEGEGPTADATGRRVAFPEAAVVDFPQYSGPAWDKHHSTWVSRSWRPSTRPIATGGRECRCASGYATVIHKS